MVSYGAPVLQGAMFPVRLITGEGSPIVGLQGVWMYAKRTILIWHYYVCWQIVRSQQRNWQRWERGGLCLDCSVCTANCGFGKGW